MIQDYVLDKSSPKLQPDLSKIDKDDPDLPSAPPLYAHCIAFIYATLTGATKDTGFVAVGFITSVRSAVRSLHRYYYLVTNEHVVCEYDPVIIRINSVPDLMQPNTCFKILSIPRARFLTDKKLDIAITALPEDPETSFVHVSEETSLKPEDFPRLKIGYGTDVFMVSRVCRHGMRYLTKNVSVMRFGNIALVPQCEETFFLTEMRSIAGHSGSPVFIYSTPFILGNARKPDEDFAPMLLGMNIGHVEESQEIFRFEGDKKVSHPLLRSSVNMAISQVVPAWHIFTMLNSKKFLKQRQKADGKLKPFAEFIPDMPKIPKGKKLSLRADGTTHMEDIKPEDKQMHREAKKFIRSTTGRLVSRKSKPKL